MNNTYEFPIDITEKIFEEQRFEVDRKSFDTERGALPQGADIYSDVNGTIANTRSYNIVGYTNVSGSFGSAQGNHTSVSSADVFGEKPLALTAVDKVQVLKLSSLSGNVAREAQTL